MTTSNPNPHPQHDTAALAGGWHAICALEEIVPSTGVCALLGGQQIAVFRLPGDQLYAVGNHDPHSGANVLSRGLVGDLDGEPVVASPIYKQHFRLRNGTSVEAPTVRIPTFAVSCREGLVWLQA